MIYVPFKVPLPWSGTATGEAKLWERVWTHRRCSQAARGENATVFNMSFVGPSMVRKHTASTIQQWIGMPLPKTSNGPAVPYGEAGDQRCVRLASLLTVFRTCSAMHCSLHEKRLADLLRGTGVEFKPRQSDASDRAPTPVHRRRRTSSGSRGTHRTHR